MAIQMRRGNEADFNENRLVAGELAVVLDQEEMYVKFGSTTKKLMTEEDAELMIASQITEVKDELEDEIGAVADSTSGKLDKTNPSGYGSVSFQRRTGSTSGSNSVTMGLNNVASGNCSVAIGAADEATGDVSAAFGYMSKASGDYSFAAGENNKAEQEGAAAFGVGTQTSGKGCMSVGTYNSADSTQKVFDVGNGTSDSSRNSAFYIKDNGDAVFDGNIEAPMFNYNSTPVLIGHQGAMPVMRKTLFGTNTSQWTAHSTDIMDIGTKNFMALNIYGFIRCNPEDDLIVTWPISDNLCAEDRYIRLKDAIPNYTKQTNAMYCITAEYILLTT